MSAWSTCIFSCLCLAVAVALVRGYDGAFEQRKIAAAEFALEELRKTSDTGVYDSIRLLEVIKAEEEEGIFHDNMIMELKLASPHFKSDHKVNYYGVIVMRHKETGARSLAIDEFPVMDETAMEEYWIAKVKRKRAEREEAFRRMELEALLMEDSDYDTSSDEDNSQGEKLTEDTLRSASVEELFSVLEEVSPPAVPERKAAVSKALLGHLDRYREQEGMSRGKEQLTLKKFADMEDEEELLQSFSLQELYTLSKGSQDGLFSDYLVYRARQILDAVLSKILYESEA